MEILPNVHLIPGIVANPYLIIDPEGLTLIDTGLPRSQKKIRRYLGTLGYTFEDLHRILITHADLDHVGGLAAIKAASHAEVASSSLEAQATEAGRMSRPLKLSGIQKGLFSLMNVFIAARAVRVERILASGEQLPMLGGLVVLETPGHTPGHLSFYSENLQILFAGDSMRSVGGHLRPSRGINTWDEQLALESMRLQANLEPHIVCVGHGPVIRDAVGKFIFP